VEWYFILGEENSTLEGRESIRKREKFQNNRERHIDLEQAHYRLNRRNHEDYKAATYL
jgi:hypothetical protein